MMTFGEWLKDKRQRAGMSQEEVAERAGCSPNYISILERSAPHTKTGALPQPTRKVVMALAQALSVNPGEALVQAGYTPSIEIVLDGDNAGEILEREPQIFKDVERASALLQELSAILHRVKQAQAQQKKTGDNH